METDKIITIEALDKSGVIIQRKETITYNGQEIPVNDEKNHYPNSITGREKFAEAVQKEDEAVYGAVMMIWGDEPTVSETPEEVTEDIVEEGMEGVSLSSF